MLTAVQLVNKAMAQVMASLAEEETEARSDVMTDTQQVTGGTGDRTRSPNHSWTCLNSSLLLMGEGPSLTTMSPELHLWEKLNGKIHKEVKTTGFLPPTCCATWGKSL